MQPRKRLPGEPKPPPVRTVREGGIDLSAELLLMATGALITGMCIIMLVCTLPIWLPVFIVWKLKDGFARVRKIEERGIRHERKP